ncbi:S9 family peptidase [Nocardia terpenica]|uniref:S9 family peptidase n=1 Tax=Nocardia terpenica TaxID=455432 RepID=UPI00189546E7|nr:prolyl oligopeptidase family serine peptidase [Nocardia terpenica]MBF6060791.1 S9 family peptidase [Nocardia terpenica]MBF6104051.1 S9 family peptidase [Nocardia terpenica]MBF6111575.1 S9 family peptidase [Nocardia terpenica]MBF6118272.1 S9 family peptidase [Nocardia terpenica]MBF6156103.1 S9 family peptidase [Nocardia terpenica]
MSTTSDSFPRRSARTQRFTLGAPRAFTVAPDGARVAFLRSTSGTDTASSLWVLDVAQGEERVAADPRVLLNGAAEDLPPEELARRERSREGGGGIVGYGTDDAVELAAFALSGRLFVAGLRDGETRELPTAGPAIDPRPSPDGRHVAYVAHGALRVVSAEGKDERALAEPESAEITYGLAEFIAAEEMGRSRGFWWSPDSQRLLVACVDNAPVRRWWISDPARPERDPQRVAYPAAGTDNADVRLFVIGLDGVRTEVVWDRVRYPYVAHVHWSQAGAPLLLVQARDQRSQLSLAVSPQTGSTRVVHADEDPVWLDLFPGTPCWSRSGRLVRIADEGDARVLVVGERALTGPRLHVRAVLDAGHDDVLITASAGVGAAAPETGEVHVYRVDELGLERISREPGVHTAVRAGGVTVLVSTTLERPGAEVRVLRDGTRVATIASSAEDPGLSPRVTLTEAGARRIPCAVLLPRDHDGKTPLPVLMDPYGGPHGQRVFAAHNPHLISQWFADQGFAVVVADGRGTPGRSPAWEKAIRDDLAAVVLEDQVHAIHALAEDFPLDLDRVAIRGWSFGGYLAALAVLRRPDVFHAAVVGAPVTDLRLYDTHYQERYLGHPDERPEIYRRNSLIDDAGLVDAADPHRPMMIIHGFADDNVVVAHSLRLSSALLAAGRPHEVLPLSGITHMTPQESVAENLLHLQLDFLRRSLG